jgi:glutathione peroxidase|tara:strand:+ start:545 stop:1030 length:486 start_codon:yes stop_codon:yes gene_type:complete
MSNLYSQVVKKSDMTDITLNEFKNKVLLIVNVASECGLTYQYEALQDLHNKYNADGLEILGFPCNQFGAQEPGSNEEIQFFCTEKYDVSFSLFDKIDVNGDSAAPIYQFLKKDNPSESGSDDIEWNFTKFLVSRDGEIIMRFGPKTEPEEIKKDIEELLNV